jgi:alpha-glucosidase
VVDEFPDRLLIGEVYLPVEELVAYYGRDLGGAHLPFNFSLLETEWHAREIASLVDRYEAALPPGGWPNWVLSNHDRPRIAGRVGPDQARIAAMLLLTLRGTPTLYYGDEIGMPQVAVPGDRVQDPFERNVPGYGLGRDGARTPMQWDATAWAGFSGVEPWLPLSQDWHSRNVVNMSGDATSIYSLYRRLIAMRRAKPSLNRGTYQPIVASGDLLLFVRSCANERVLVALNFGGEPIQVEFPSGEIAGKVLVSCWGDRDGEGVDGSVALRGDDGVVVELSPGAAVPAAIV